MRTLLSLFCDEFDEAVRPLLEPLQRTSDTLSAAGRDVACRAILPGLLDVRHQLQALVEKVAGQQAYVLIFGPLKSGKSTLMNAMSAAYVSEVTSLPAYPCMVFVSDSDKKEFEVTRYDGRADRFTDPTAMRIQIERAHKDLAEHIRAVEAKGEEFDPAVHFPEAVRKVDVRLPAGDLAQSGAVLVDTPGLYTRMKFGYDRMTREFKNAAACAIFCVKSENLFLEQVFAEFEQLLDMFSRIFLVVNLDTAKRDLKPDGSLVPSLEREDPIRIIEAFETLAMSAALKKAADGGRLRIYPVDLLRAASRRLSGTAEEEDPDERGQADFDAFLGDLTEYLNSTDYLVHFLGDSLRHARNLLDEATSLCGDLSVAELAREVRELESRASAATAKHEAVKRLSAHDWTAAFGRLRDDLSAAARKPAREIEDKTANALLGAVDAWFQGDESLEALNEDGLRPLLASCQTELARFLHDALARRVRGGNAGIALPGASERDLATAGIELSLLGRDALDRLDLEARIAEATAPLETEDVPVRKTFWDWILFRRKAAVRRRLFGPASRPRNPIPRALKQRRLGEPARDAMRLAIDEHQERFFPATLDRLAKRVFHDYREGVTKHLSATLSTKREALEAELADLRRRLEQRGEVLSRLQALESRLSETAGSVDALARRYGDTAPHLLVQAVPDPDGETEASREAPSNGELADVELVPRASEEPRAGEPRSDEPEEHPDDAGEDSGDDSEESFERARDLPAS